MGAEFSSVLVLIVTYLVGRLSHPVSSSDWRSEVSSDNLSRDLASSQDPEIIEDCYHLHGYIIAYKSCLAGWEIYFRKCILCWFIVALHRIHDIVMHIQKMVVSS